MKPIKTKQQLRAELNQQVHAFLNHGGAVTQVERGLSGNTDNKNLFKQTASFEPKQSRTPVTEVVKELEARKQGEHDSKSRRPKKVLIKDDFGEPIRWVWQE